MTAVEEKPNEDNSKLHKALQAERTGHRAAQSALRAAQARIQELETQSTLGDSPSAGKVSELIAASVAAKVAAETGESQKKLAALEGQLAEATTAKAALEAKLNRRTVDDAVRAAAVEAHVKPEALADVLTIGSLELQLAPDGAVTTKDGLSVQDWIEARKSISIHWWPAARGAGGRGSLEAAAPEANNPFAPGASFSLTRQGQMLRESPSLAARLQQEAGAMTRN